MSLNISVTYTLLMLVSLRSILESPAADAGRPEVLTGNDQLDKAMVRWVHISESPNPAGLLEGGELILTTGLPFHDPETPPEKYLETLIELGVSALAVEAAGPSAQIPPQVISLARRHNFPIVIFHRVVRFVEITEQVHRSIIAGQYSDLQFSKRVHEEMTALSLGNASVQEIVERAAALSRNVVILENLSRRVLAYATYGMLSTGLLNDWNTRSRLASIDSETAISGPEGWLTTPVGTRENVWGRLVIPRVSEGSAARLGMLLERTAQALELGRIVEREQESLYYQAQNTFLDDLREGRATDEDEVTSRAEALGLTASEVYLPVVVHVPQQSTDDPYAGHRQRRRLLERVAKSARDARLSALVGALQSNQIGMIIGCHEGNERASMLRLASVLRPHGKEGVEPDVTIALGQAARKISSASMRISLTQHIAIAAAGSGALGLPYYRSVDVRLKGLLSILADDPRMQAFVEAELNDLLVHDAQRGTDLLQLLRDYVAVGGNKSKLARKTHASRPTLYKHLARIESILGVSLEDPESYLSLGVAILAHEISVAEA